MNDFFSKADLSRKDAESIISSRENSRSNTVSNLLNLSDGLLSDCLNIQIICTFNIPICEVDNAFLRAGRLLGAYEFKPLCIDKATQLIKKHALNKFINPLPIILNTLPRSISHFDLGDYEQF